MASPTSVHVHVGCTCRNFLLYEELCRFWWFWPSGFSDIGTVLLLSHNGSNRDTVYRNSIGSYKFEFKNGFIAGPRVEWDGLSPRGARGPGSMSGAPSASALPFGATRSNTAGTGAGCMEGSAQLEHDS